ncbi:hypothetical protein [Hyphomicrobium sp.]|uniref:hypothetical protein n=1 Tax=Hyphomicrobium sp. TaxID=82 RepID=UPI000FA42A37|nr:hypothetical protein [Hyphomicrobium sp.]RUP08678.1 MAG: hypothetical protein EKK38_13085 [Hyphomicrobium sp.]
MATRALIVATMAVLTFALGVRADPIDPAQAIAQKFSAASDEEIPKPSPKPAAKPSPKPAPKLSAAASKPDADYEADMLSRARAEEADRQKQEARPQQLAAEPAVPAAPVPVPPPAVAPAPEKQPAPVPVAATPAPKPEIQRPIVAESPKSDTTQATVLLVLDDGGGALGFKPDPIICIDQSCWLSNGIEAPAVSMPRTQAIALQTTQETTSDPCAGKSACVYRSITIDADARIEVIEVGESRGASAGAFTIAADKSCRNAGGGLLCDNGLATQNFRIWVVPEAIAAATGPEGLEEAIAEGLPEPDAAAGNDK